MTANRIRGFNTNNGYMVIRIILSDSKLFHHTVLRIMKCSLAAEGIIFSEMDHFCMAANS